jgi:chromosome segregation ATPase
MASQFLGGLRDGFERKPCRAQGERYPGCPLDQIEPRQRGYDDAGQAMHVAQLEGTIAEAREVIAGLLAEKQELEQRATDFSAWQRAVAERDRALGEAVAQCDALAANLAEVTATKDRFKASGKRVLAELRDMRAILEIPGVLDAAQKAARIATHPDKGRTEADRRARTAKFQESEAAFERLRRHGAGMR